MTRRSQTPIPLKRSGSLSYVDDHGPGIERKPAGRSFQYRRQGQIVRDKSTLDRIRSLAIPPAWKQVWICQKPNGHLQATGIDARGRKQYLYHPLWREQRDAAKYSQLINFAEALPRIRRRVTADLRQRGLPRSKVLAAIIRLMEKTLIRVGNDEYAKANGSFGLTTFCDRHVHIKGAKICFEFRGKSGIEHEIDLEDRTISTIVRQCQDLPGQQLFQYQDEFGKIHDVGSADVNEYLREISQGDFTAKDFRTWAGTSLAAEALKKFEEFTSATIAKRNVSKAIEEVAKRLGNTKTICRKCYVHPAVIEAYLNRSLVTAFGNARARSPRLSQTERGVLALIQSQLAKKSPDQRSR